MKNVLTFLFLLFLPVVTFAEKNDFSFSPEFKSTEEILAAYNNQQSTNCVSQIFSNALKDNANAVSELDEENVVQTWAKTTMLSADVLSRVLQCPEITSVSDDTKIIFTPIIYKFPMGRTLTINYSATPKVLKQHYLLATKRSLPNGDPNPKLMDPNDPAKYLNTEPSWYAIMVVQHDSLSEFVGPEKNNTVSLKWLDDNMDKVYPKGYHCTSRSAITPTNDYDTINQVVREVVDIEKDSNDYYVAGDVNLEWVMYAEIAADIIITVVTWGYGAAATGALKGVRAAKTSKNLIKSAKTLSKLDDVKKYTNVVRKVGQHSDDIAKISKNIKNAEKYEKALAKAEKARKAGKDATKYEKEAQEILEAAQKIDPKTTADSLKNIDKLKDQEKTLQDALKAAEKEAKELEKTSENVAQYKETTNALSDLMKYRRELRAFRRPQTGNVITRTLKSLKSLNSGADKMTKAGRIARRGMSSRSARMADWLRDATLKHGARLAKFESTAGLLYGIVAFLGDLYDRTSATSKEFSNGIEFKPLCLLSADDLEGQENVVNYGMWLMWTGNSTDASDDDAAYLQAMDFASKFYYQLDEYQDAHGANCNIDIFVVHPIIRLDETNVDDPHGEMFYLVMNENPWTTAEQFGEQITNVNAWEITQQQLEKSDPNNKYNRQAQISE